MKITLVCIGEATSRVNFSQNSLRPLKTPKKFPDMLNNSNKKFCAERKDLWVLVRG